jgi:uncharacterized repeat protein (TIGR01451 family)
MRFNNQNRFARSQTMRTATFLVLVVLFVMAGVPKARTQATPIPYVWNRNQKFLCGHSPSTITTIPRNYDTTLSCSASLCPGQLIHIVHGIESHANDSNPVTITIHLLPVGAFTVTGMQVLKFPLGAGSGTPVTGLSASNLPSFVIGALNATDKVIVLIDGYFTQAGSSSATFDITDAPNGTQSDPQFTLSFDSTCTNPQVDIAITKEVQDSSGHWISSATWPTWPFGSTVPYRLTVKNLSTADLDLGKFLQVNDTLSVPSTNGVDLDLTVSYSPCTALTGTGTDCVSVPFTSTTATLYRGYYNSVNLPMLTYPVSSNGFLPAGGSFVIPFTVLIKTSSTCYTTQTYQLDNVASITYHDANNVAISDHDTSNDRSFPPNTTVTLTPAPAGASNPCPSPTPTPAIPVTKTVISPTSPSNALPWGPFTYEITFTTPSTTLTGLTLSDYVYGTGTPPFTATFAASNVNCTPASACPVGSITPATAAPLVGNSYTSLFGISFGSLPPNTTITITYQVQYDAPCADVATSGSITNAVFLGGPATGYTSATSTMATLPLCQLEVDKTDTSGPTAATWPLFNSQNLSYHVVFKNNSTQAITVGTVVDAIAEDSAQYGNVPIDYSYTCSLGPTASDVTIPGTAVFPTKLTTPGLIQYNSSGPTYGYPLLNFSGATFKSGGYIDCNLNVTLKQPSTTDSLCEGKGKTHDIINAAFMNLLPNNYNKPPTMPSPSPQWYQDVTTPLPDCVSIQVGKTAPPTVSPGGAVTFTLTVKNTGKDPVSGVVLHDLVPTTLTGPYTWLCQTGCTYMSPTSGNGNILATLTNLPAGATVTIALQATAPTEIPAAAICNDASAEFEPPPAQTYFEGDPMEPLTHAEACVQVSPSAGSPTPTPTASPVDTSSPTPTPTPTPTATPGCAQITGDARCLPNGGYSYTITITNNSGKPMSQILLTPVQGSTFTLTPQLTNLTTPLQNGQSTTVTTNIGNVKAGDKVCFFVSLMSDKAPCCIIQVCPTLPQCGGVSPTPTVTSSSPPTLRQQRPPRPSRQGRRRR